MRNLTPVLSAAAVVVLLAANLVAQGKPSFAGEWKIVADSDRDGGRGGRPGSDLTITQSATAMTLEYPKAPAPAKLTYTKVRWEGNTLVVTTTIAAGEEKRTFSLNGGYLVVETSTPSRDGSAPRVTKVTYKRYERGAGG